MGLYQYLIKRAEKEIEQNEKLDNEQTKEKFKTVKEQLEDAKIELESYKDKYTLLLEEKGEGFNQYILWQNRANELELELKDTKRELLNTRKDLKNYDELMGTLFVNDTITSLNKCSNYVDFLIYILSLYYQDKELPLKGIKDTCLRLEITKAKIKRDSEYLYKALDVDTWEID